jgi:nucleoside-diphosphate-sugar epimerase
VFLSSLKAMGESTPERPFKAGDIEAPEDAYGRSKLSAERELQKIAARSGLELVIIRPPLVYGPGVKANFKLLQKLAALPLPLPFAMVHNRRDMVAVENLCSLMVCCLTHPAAAGQTLLVSDGEAYSLAGILRTMRQVNGRRPGLVPVPPSWLRCLLRLLGRGAMAERLLGNLEVDISETQRLLGWQPVTNLEQTLAQMLEAEKPL